MDTPWPWASILKWSNFGWFRGSPPYFRKPLFPWHFFRFPPAAFGPRAMGCTRIWGFCARFPAACWDCWKAFTLVPRWVGWWMVGWWWHLFMAVTRTRHETSQHWTTWRIRTCSVFRTGLSSNPLCDVLDKLCSPISSKFGHGSSLGLPHSQKWQDPVSIFIYQW